MTLKHFKIFLFSFVAFGTISCEHILFVDDISDKEVVLLAPLENAEIASGDVFFSWENLEDATNYQLQLASPDFERANQILIDTLISKRTFSKQLLANDYEWRLRAVNSEYATKCVSSNFKVIASEGFGTSLVNLTSPLDNLVTNSTSQVLSWNTLKDATEYRIQVWSPDIQGTLVLDEIVTGTSQNVTFAEGTFIWQVRGQNANENTLYSLRNVLIDTTAPSNVVLATPTNGANLTETLVNYSWTRSDVAGSTEIDSLFVYSDVTLQTLSFKAEATNKSFEREMTAGTYYWFVKSFDKAGNENTQSSTFNFDLN